ncbi:MAG: caspase family protein [Aquimonas sp.]|nr:caspase family protein [Aquimonas sp.]
MSSMNPSRTGFSNAHCMRVYAALVGAVLVVAGAGAAPIAEARGARVATAEDLMIVDCLLPGQVRRLGGQASFMAARRPIRTSQADCAIRGGEFVAFDRADYRTALQVWLGAAESGDAEAQNYVGEIHLKGLGIAPDPARAASWFERAVAGGNRRAMANLALLLEEGEGVGRDPLRALNLYRQSAGAGDELLYASVVRVELATRDAEIERQRGEITRLQARVEALQRELGERRQALQRLQGERADLLAELESARQRAGAAEQALVAQRSQMEAQEAQLEQLRARLAQQQQALERRRDQAISEAAAIDAAAAPADSIAEQKQRLQSALAAGERQIADTETALAAAESGLQALRDEYDQRISELEARLDARANEDWRLMKVLETQLVQRDSVLRDQRMQIAMLEQERMREGEMLAANAPSLELISPALALTRSGGGAAVRSSGGRQAVVGRVDRPAMVERLTVNQLPVVLAENGLFRATLEVPTEGTEVEIRAYGRRGETAELSFSLLPMEQQAAAPRSLGSLPQGVKSGRAYALVVGNNRYVDEGFPPLASAVNDATAVARLLRERYGHEVRLLLDANRLDMLSALAELRDSLKPDDSLLVYYAGHGELSASGSEGYWIPVDGRRASPDSWVSNRSISSLIEAMPARQVLVVADSCYSGALVGASIATYAATEPGADWDVWVRGATGSKARLALTSGGLQPVPDSGSGEHSYFARAFLNVLSANARVLEGGRLHREINSALAFAALDAPVSQVPQYAPIQFAGHEAGEFFFAPASRRR